METNLLSEELMEIAQKIANVEGINEFEVQVQEKNKKGEGFVGEFEFLDICDTKSKQIKNYAVKKEKQTSKEFKALASLDYAFINELNFYTKMLTAFSQFQEKWNIRNKFPNVPRCLMTCSEPGSQMLVLENLKSAGFMTTVKSILFDDEHVKLILYQYAHFHALSFAFREQCPEDFRKIKNDNKDIWENLLERTFMLGIFTGSCKLAAAALTGIDERIVKEYQKYVDHFMEKFSSTLTSDEKYSVILHGDCWSNNMMFKYDESGKPTDIRLIDWQAWRFGSPAIDVSHIMYSGAGKDILDNLDYYLKIYYSTFSDFLKKLGCDAEQLYPYERLLEDWKKLSKFGMIIGLSCLKLKFTSQEDIRDFDDIESFDMSDMEQAISKTPFNKELFYKAAKDLILHVYERGAL